MTATTARGWTIPAAMSGMWWDRKASMESTSSARIFLTWPERRLPNQPMESFPRWAQSLTRLSLMISKAAMWVHMVETKRVTKRAMAKAPAKIPNSSIRP